MLEATSNGITAILNAWAFPLFATVVAWLARGRIEHIEKELEEIAEELQNAKVQLARIEERQKRLWTNREYPDRRLPDQ